MNTILETRDLAPSIRYLRVEAPKIARRRKAGQFVIVRVDGDGERIPLTIADSDSAEGWIGLVVQGVGKTTKAINRLQRGDSLSDVAGPLGMPSRIELVGTAVVIGGGVGTAIAYPTAVALKEAGNRVVSIIGAQTSTQVVLEPEMRDASSELYVATDDGSAGYHGFVTGKLSELIAEGGRIDLVVAIGPVAMMRAVAEVTRPHGIETIVSLNPVMVDGTGMCGGCRVAVGNETKFTCVDGPEFDGHQVDFDLLARRNQAYASFERARDVAPATVADPAEAT
ncbi:MAG: sulfide/dihydroorotate dehydrogenase-like FAD/NAD-binding protein [Actinomycetia bacterium]|nr:sulfide/dihydroorotate dehydrogenase-like FAD/NAD-binding protein [Actinomycetes bacterium]MCP4084170.1 sulfide/dihydroorotate dehydrogenase-like FAD/NAD-binding protein [Actinomycetes bacterium]